MQFQLLSPLQLAGITGRLPADLGSNKKILLTGTVSPTRIYPGLHYRQWITEKNFLQQYTQTNRAAELEIGEDENFLRQWTTNAAGQSLRICRRIIVNSLEELIFDGAFSKNANDAICICINFPPPAKNPTAFINEEITKMLPGEGQLFLEFTDPLWFTQKEVKTNLLKLLRKLETGLVITDYLADPALLHMALTIPKTMVRFAANNLDDSDYLRLDQWVDRIRMWMDSGIEDVYFFIHSPDEKYLADLGDYFTDQLRRICGY